MQYILTEQEYADLKELADKADNYEKLKNLYNELMSQHLALKDEHEKLLVFSVSSNNEKLAHQEIFVFNQ